DLNPSESRRPPLPFAPPHSATPSCSKGRLIPCTVPGLRSPDSFPSAGAIGGRPKALTLTPGPREASTDSFRNHRPLELGKHAHHLKHRLPGGVVVSSPCWRRNRSILSACSFDVVPHA